MFDIVWHLRGSVPLDDAASEESALDGLERLLEKQRKGVSARGPDYLAFDEPLWSNFFGSNWLAMVMYDRGRFWVEKGFGRRALHYDLRSLHGLILCLFAALMFFFFGFPDSGLAGSAKFAAGAFAWLYGMNVLLAVARVPSAIRKAVHNGQQNIR